MAARGFYLPVVETAKSKRVIIIFVKRQFRLNLLGSDRTFTLSKTTSLMCGKPSGLCMLALMNWKPSRNSRSYRFFSSGLMGFHCSVRGTKKRKKIKLQDSSTNARHLDSLSWKINIMYKDFLDFCLSYTRQIH